MKRLNHIFMIETLNFILHKNYLIFNESYYRQTCGIGMGTKAAPFPADMIICSFEFALYEISLQKYDCSLYFDLL